MDGRSAGKEIEFKLGVPGPEALGAIAAAAQDRGARAEEPLDQVNHFFDTADGALRRGGYALRLREEAGRRRLTAKGAPEDAGGAEGLLHARAEEEVDLTAEEAAALLAGEASPLSLLLRGAEPSPLVRALESIVRDAPLVRAGSFSNRRTRVGPLAVGRSSVVLELDRTSLPGGRVDCEVELEVPESEVEAGRALLRDLLGAAGVEGRPVESKAARFFAALEEQASS